MSPYIFFFGALAAAAAVLFRLKLQPEFKARRLLNRLGPEAPVRIEGGFTYRDLNKNGRLDPYEDSRLPLEARVEDLLGQMTLEEKAGLMFHTMIGMKEDGGLTESSGVFSLPATPELVIEHRLNHFNVLEITLPELTAAWHNRLQKLAERTRLGIPVSLSSDPRHSFNQNLAANMRTEHFSQWPEPVGLAASGDPALAHQFGDLARQEYLAVGIRIALHPMADLATEPRWCRVNGTFGEDADLSARMTAAYIRGFQGETIGPHSVACMTKHFPGGGPQKEGEDAHFEYGKEQVYPGDNFDYHLRPFEAAFEAGTAMIMPYYGQPVGLELEEVGFAFNKQIISGLLRGKYGFDGVVCTDWMQLHGVQVLGKEIVCAKGWGVEHLSPSERALKALEAGVDQFGGESCPELIVELVRAGKVSQSRIDESARRILRDKFRLGLFDNPYVDVKAAGSICGKAEFRLAGELAQRRAMVLLKNQDGILPLQKGLNMYAENIQPELLSRYGKVVATPAEADLVILRLKAPFQKRKGLVEGMFHAGDLDFKSPEKERLLSILEQAPAIVDIYLERPAVIPEIAEKCQGLLADFGASDEAVLAVIFGEFTPTGKLPFELPSSMEAVRQQKEDLPYDSEAPLFPFGYGLTYQV
jgi:beta-glucosidase